MISIDINYYRLDARGEPVKCSLDDWINWRTKADDRAIVVNQTQRGSSLVSTVFTGIGTSINGAPAAPFETAVFDGAQNGPVERYATRGEAIEGHKAWVKKTWPGGKGNA